MGDLMGDWVPDRWIHQVIEAIWDAPQHTFQLLTKNPARYREFKWPPNVWFGTSIDGNGGSMERLAIMRDDDLLNWGDAIRFVSFEPLLADVTAHPEFELDGLDWVIVGAQTGPGADPINLNYVANLGYQVICRRIPFFMKDNVPTRILRIQEFPDSDLKELTKSMDGDEMDVCPHCDVEMEPKRDGKTGEIFCTNCLDTLR
jgi:protein gp37